MSASFIGHAVIDPTPMRAIVKACAEVCGLTTTAIMNRRRQPWIARARHMAMYLMRERLKYSYPVIGRFFEMDHTSVLHAVRIIEKAVVTDSRTCEALAKVNALLDGKVETAAVSKERIGEILEGRDPDAIIRTIKDHVQGIWVAMKALERSR